MKSPKFLYLKLLLISLIFGLSTEFSFAQAQLEISSPTTWSSDLTLSKSVVLRAKVTVTTDITIYYHYADLNGDAIGDLSFDIEEGGELYVQPGASVTFSPTGSPGPGLYTDSHWAGININQEGYTLKGNITVNNALNAVTVNANNVSIYNLTADVTKGIVLDGKYASLKYVTVTNVGASGAGINVNADSCRVEYLSLTTSASPAVDVDETIDAFWLTNSEIDGGTDNIYVRGTATLTNVSSINASQNALYVQSGSVTATNCSFDSNTMNGLSVGGSNSYVNISDSHFENNTEHGIYIGPGLHDVQVSNSNLLNNDAPDNYFVRSEASAANAAEITGNWWGTTTDISTYVQQTNIGSVDFSGWLFALDASFGATLMNSVTQSVSISNLADDAIFVAGEPFTLRWDSEGNIPYVDIDVSGVGGEVMDITTLPNTGEVEITFQAGEITGGAGDGSLEIASSANGAINDMVDRLNTADEIGLNYPTGGEIFFGQDTVNISWEVSSTWAQVKVQYNPDVTADPTNFTTIATMNASDGSLEWVVPNESTGSTSGSPNQPSMNGQIRIIKNGDASAPTATSGSFMVIQKPKVTGTSKWKYTESARTMTLTINDVDLLADMDDDGVVNTNENMISTTDQLMYVGAFYTVGTTLKNAGFAIIDNNGADGVQNDFTDDETAEGGTADDNGTTAESVSITIYGDDPSTPSIQEGPEEGDALTFYIWRTSWDEEDNTNKVDENGRLATLFALDGTTATPVTFANGATPTAEQLIYTRDVNAANFRPAHEAQNIVLPDAGGWTLISSYIMPADPTLGYNNTAIGAGSAIFSSPSVIDASAIDAGYEIPDPDGAGVLTPASYQGIIHDYVAGGSGSAGVNTVAASGGFDQDDDFVMLKDGLGSVYWNTDPLDNTQVEIDQVNNTWDYTKGYMIYTKNLGGVPTAIRFIGPRVVPEETPIELSSGWNLIPYLRKAPIDADLALADIAADLDVVKDQDGNLFWPRFGINNIGDFEPGKAYWAYMKSATELRYPSNVYSGKKAPTVLENTKSRFFTLSYSSDRSMIIALDVNDLLLSEKLDKNAEIAVLDKNQQVMGAAAINKDGFVVLSVMGKSSVDQAKHIAFEDAEELNFVFKSSSSQTYQPLVITDENKQPILFENNKVVQTAAKLTVDNQLPTTVELSQNYPNPFNPSTTIQFALPEQMNVSLAIYDITGRMVTQLVQNQSLSQGYHSYSFDASNNASGVYFARLQTSASTQIIKMTLLK